MQALLDRFDRFTAIARRNPMAWPALMVVLGGGALLAALVIEPRPDQFSYLFGLRFGGECGFLEATQKPCPSCGMTRSWLWLARGDVVRAFQYNAAGALLLIGLVTMAGLGVLRLITRDPNRARVPMSLLSGVVMAWMLGPYLAVWILRMFGYFPMPGA